MHIALVSHHKTGTSYTTKVIRDFMRSKQQSFAHHHAFLGWVHRQTGVRMEKFLHLNEPTIYHIANVRAPIIKHLPKNTKILHFIRDPRGLILSSIDYHKRGSEPLLNEPSDDFAGKTYAEQLRSLGCQAKEVAFEICNGSGRQIADMKSMMGLPNVQRFKIEDISHDRTCETHFQLARATGLQGVDLLLFFEAACRHALWRQNAPVVHATTGVATDYETRFLPEAISIYNSKLGDLHRLFGYADQAT